MHRHLQVRKRQRELRVVLEKLAQRFGHTERRKKALERLPKCISRHMQLGGRHLDKPLLAIHVHSRAIVALRREYGKVLLVERKTNHRWLVKKRIIIGCLGGRLVLGKIARIVGTARHRRLGPATHGGRWL